jgi:ABC-type sugar transport system ATPase subunit
MKARYLLMNEYLLEMKDISKRFPGVLALDRVNLNVKKGEVHALLGENGAGKSTLIKILGGIYKADAGEVFVEGEKIQIHDVEASSRLGVSVVHQELCLALNLTVAENIFVGRIPKKKGSAFIDRKKMNQDAYDLCVEYGLDLSPDTRLNSLSIAQQQMVELAKAMSVDARIIVLDEPTGPLTHEEIDKLFSAIERFKQRGVSFIYISHRLEEVFRIADRATILRDGKYITTQNVSDLTYHDLVSHMIGRELKDMYAKPEAVQDSVLMEVKNMNIGRRVKDVSFHVKKGEVLGFYGLIGSGRTELMRGVFGIDPISSGEILIDGERIKKHNSDLSISKGIAFVPENRKEQGLTLINSVAFNLTMSIWKRLVSGIRVRHREEKRVVGEYIQKLAIKTPTTATWVNALSGGNQQKVVVAKGLATKPKLLILDEPTRGIDVGAKKEIYEIMNELVKEGVSIIMISSEMSEVINMSNRIYVMHEGRITGELAKHEINEKQIMIYATGGMDH